MAARGLLFSGPRLFDTQGVVMNNKPNPGTQEAMALGCICPVIDNNHGKGIQIKKDTKTETVFWHNADCPIHGLDSEK